MRFPWDFVEADRIREVLRDMGVQIDGSQLTWKLTSAIAEEGGCTPRQAKANAIKKSWEYSDGELS